MIFGGLGGRVKAWVKVVFCKVFYRHSLFYSVSPLPAKHHFMSKKRVFNTSVLRIYKNELS